MELLNPSTGRKSAGLADDEGRLLVSSSEASSGSTGDTDDLAWNGTDDDASVISLLKAIYAKLDEIATNTAGEEV